jgi:hypothetical protein
MSRLTFALDQIAFARGYSTRLIDAVDPSEWFRIPPSGVSHVGWQVGHLTMAQYLLALDRIRGPRPEDEDLIPSAFLARFRRETVPDSDPSAYPEPAEIRAVFDRVNDQVLRELAGLDEAALDEPALRSHSIARTKLDSLLWCARHELVHAGQIGLLRRQLGHEPLW